MEPEAVFAGNIPTYLTVREVEMFFLEIGEYLQIQVPNRTSPTNVLHGHAYIRCKESETEKFFSKRLILRGQSLVMRKILNPCEIAQIFDFTKPQKLVFVRGIPATVSNEHLAIIFSEFGEVRHAYAIRSGKKDKSIYYGFIEYKEKAPLEELKSKVAFIDGCPCCILPFIEMPKFLEDKGFRLIVPNNPAMSVGYGSWLELSREKFLDHTTMNLSFNKISLSHQNFILRNSIFKLRILQRKMNFRLWMDFAKLDKQEMSHYLLNFKKSHKKSQTLNKNVAYGNFYRDQNNF